MWLTSSRVQRSRTSRARGPQSPKVAQAEVRSLSLRRAVTNEAVDEPLFLGHAGGAAGDDPESIGTEAHDGEVALEAAPFVEQRGVDDTTDRHVHLRDREVLEAREGSLAGDVQDHEGREVDEPTAVAQRQVLRVDDRGPPARLPLGGALHDPPGVALEQGLVALIPEWPFPARGLEEHRVEVARAIKDRRAPRRTLGLPLLHGVDDAVHLVEALAGAGLNVLACALMIVETRDVRLVEVDLGSLPAHPLSDRTSDAGALLDPTRGDRPDPLHLGGLSEGGVAVGCHGDEPVDRVAHADALVAEQFGHQLEGILELGVEVVLGEGQLGR